MGALRVCCIILVLLASACTGASTPTDGGSSGEGGGANGVKNPGVLVHAQGGEPDSLDPARAEPGGRGGQAIIQGYEMLVARPVEGPEFIPSLGPGLQDGIHG